MIRSFAALAMVLVFGQAAVPPPKIRRNPDAANVRNPVAATAESATAGRVCSGLCVRCHGPAGRGDGEAAAGATPSDLTDAKWTYGSSDGELFAVIHDGTSPDMDGYAERISDTDIWNVVNYVRTFKAAP